MYQKYYELPVREGQPFPAPLSDQVACAPFEEYLGMRIEEAGRERTVLSMDFRTKLAQSKGFMHGGAIASLAHSTLAVAIKTQLTEGNDFEIITFSLRFHGTLNGGTVKAHARIVDLNERDIIGEVQVFDQRGGKAATFTAAYRKNRASNDCTVPAATRRSL